LSVRHKGRTKHFPQHSGNYSKLSKTLFVTKEENLLAIEGERKKKTATKGATEATISSKTSNIFEIFTEGL
jgi:hypothetical protein